jgi:uncharacterized protein
VQVVTAVVGRSARYPEARWKAFALGVSIAGLIVVAFGFLRPEWGGGGAALAFAVDVPYLSGRVVDDAEILLPATRERLAATSKAHETRTTNQVVVLTVPTLGGESVEEYANRVFAAWKLGQQGKDNGVLCSSCRTIARCAWKWATASKALSDVALRESSRPHDALIQGGGSMEVLLKARRDRRPVERARRRWWRHRRPSTPATSAVRLFRFGPARSRTVTAWSARIPLATTFRRHRRVHGHYGYPGSGWFLYFFLIPFWAMFPIIIVGVKGALALLSA